MIKHILVVFAIFISTTTFSQQLLTQKEKQETEELLTIIRSYAPKEILVSDFYKLDLIDMPKNYKSILRRQPCWKVTGRCYAICYNGKCYIDTESFGDSFMDEIYFVFTSKGYWEYYLNEDPTIYPTDQPHQCDFHSKPPKIMMFGNGNKFVVCWEMGTLNNEPRDYIHCVTYLIEPDTHKTLNSLKSQLKKEKKIAEQNNGINE